MLFGKFCDCSFVTIYCDCGFRTDNGAGGTAGTIRVVCLSGEITVFIGLFGDYDAVLWAHLYAQAATLTTLDIYDYFTSHLIIYAMVSFQFDSVGDSNSKRQVCKAKRQYSLWLH